MLLTRSCFLLAFCALSPCGVFAATTWNGANNIPWTSVGNWSSGLPDTSTPNPGIISSGTPVANAQQNANYTVNGTGVLRVELGTSISTEVIDVGSGGRLEYNIASASGNTIQLSNGGAIGRINSSSPVDINSSDTISIAADSDVFLRGASNTSSRILVLRGAITSDNLSTVTRDTVSGAGEIRIAPTSVTGNTGLGAQFFINGASNSSRGILAVGGTIPLGTGAGGNVQVGNFGVLRLFNNTGVTSTGIVDVLSGGQIDIQSTSSTGNIFKMQDGSSIARDSGQVNPAAVKSSDTFQIDPGAEITIFGANNTASRFLDLDGVFTGTNVTIVARNRGAQMRPIRLSSTAGNALSGTLIVRGDSVAQPGQLELSGTSPIGTMNVQVEDFGRLEMRTAGILDNRSIMVHEEGNLVLNNTSSSATATVLTGVTLGGTGTVTSVTTNLATARALTLNNVELTPGFSTGTLTFDVSTLSLDAGSTLFSEISLSAADLIVVEGNLDLTAGPTLQLDQLGPLPVGTHTIATYTGTLTGEFGEIVNNISGLYTLDYGLGSNSSITVTIEPFPIPEPGSAVLLGLGLIGLAGAKRRTRNPRV